MKVPKKPTQTAPEAATAAPELRKHFDSSDELCEYMAAQSDGCALLAFSTGKDSIAAWLKMRRYFRKIVPYYLYCMPGLEFVEHSLEYYEDWFGCHIIRMPHPSLYRWLREFIFQAPENLSIIENARLAKFDDGDVCRLIRQTDPELANAYQATGVRSADSIVRRQTMMKHGQVNHKTMKFYPVFDYKKEDMVRELEASEIALPIDYEWFGRSFDGLDYRFTSVLKEKAPRDYARLQEAFPLLELDSLRMQYRKEYHTRGGIAL